MKPRRGALLPGRGVLFVVFDSDGRVEREFGRAGGGPAEFGAPQALVYAPESGEVWTYDLLRHALIELAAGAMRQLRLPLDSLAPTRLVSFAGARAFSGASMAWQWKGRLPARPGPNGQCSAVARSASGATGGTHL